MQLTEFIVAPSPDVVPGTVIVRRAFNSTRQLDCLVLEVSSRILTHSTLASALNDIEVERVDDF